MKKKITVTNCSACGQEHLHLEFESVKVVIDGVAFDWSAICPVTGMRIFEKDEPKKAKAK